MKLPISSAVNSNHHKVTNWQESVKIFMLTKIKVINLGYKLLVRPMSKDSQVGKLVQCEHRSLAMQSGGT